MPARPAGKRLKAKTQALIKTHGKRFTAPEPKFKDGRYIAIASVQAFANEDAAKRHAESLLAEGATEVMLCRVISEAKIETIKRIEWS